MGPCDIGRVRSPGRFHLVWIPIDDPGLDTYQSAPASVFDYLQVLPIFARLGHGSRSASPTVVWHLSPSPQHRFAIAPFAIGGHGRGLTVRGMPLDLSHQLGCGLLFRLSES